jgi:hypothetical protein
VEVRTPHVFKRLTAVPTRFARRAVQVDVCFNIITQTANDVRTVIAQAGLPGFGFPHRHFCLRHHDQNKISPLFLEAFAFLNICRWHVMYNSGVQD